MIEMSKLRIAVLSGLLPALIIIIGFLPNTTHAGTFCTGDTIEVYNTGSSGLLVRDAPCGNKIGGKFDGSRGTILTGPAFCESHNRWQIRWSDGLTGWSAETYLRKVTQVLMQYTLNINTNGQGTTNPGAGVYTHSQGSQVTIIAFPASGWKFDRWGGDASGSSTSITVTMNSNKSITAYFVSSGPPGSGATNLTEYYAAWGKSLPSISERGRIYGALGLGTASGYSGTAQQNELLLSALKQRGICPSTGAEIGYTERYTLTTSSSGSGTVTPASGSYDDGARVTLIASPTSGWQFSHWGGDASGTSTSLTITMNSNKNITAHFSQAAPTQYTLNINTNGQGTTNPGAGVYTHSQGSQVTITAFPASGWKFDRWGGDASGSSTSITVTMNSNKNVIAYFIEASAVTLLPAPSLSSPGNGQSGVSASPTFSWSPVSGANKYWLVISTSQGSLPTNTNATSAPGCMAYYTTSTSYSVSGLSGGTTYYWEVQAFNDTVSPIRQGQYSTQWSFTTQSSYFTKNEITFSDSEKQAEILKIIDSCRGIFPRELIAAIIRLEGGKGAFYLEGYLYNQFYLKNDGSWAQPTNGDGIMQVTSASGYHEKSGRYTNDRDGYYHAIKDGCDYLSSQYSQYGTDLQAVLHYNTGPASLYIYMGRNWGDRNYLTHTAEFMTDFVPLIYGLQNPNLVGKLNEAQKVVTRYLQDTSILQGQNVDYYKPYQTSLDKELNSIRNVPARDVNPPVVTLVSPQEGLTVTQQSIEVSGTAYDESGVSKVEIKTGVGNWQTAEGTNTWKGTLILASGQNTILARGYDKAGNTSSDIKIQITYNPPGHIPIPLPDDIGSKAASYAKQVIGGKYLGDGRTWGGKGYNWDPERKMWKGGRYVEPFEIIGGYFYYDNRYASDPNNIIRRGQGLDCSGLVHWAYNKANNTKDLYPNLVPESAAEQRNKFNVIGMKITDLKPGDLLFFEGPDYYHVAMYVGEFDNGYDVVHAYNETDGIKRDKASSLIKLNTFKGFGRVPGDIFVQSQPIATQVQSTDQAQTSSQNTPPSIIDYIRNIFKTLFGR